jgi:ketosteroid isomerase-like protein
MRSVLGVVVILMWSAVAQASEADVVTKVADKQDPIGSGPNERTTSGAVLAKAWKAAWQGKSTVTSLAARVTEAGTTGWVAASVDLQKKGYKVPFLVFCVFETTKDGAWSLVHVHFAV